MLEVANLSFAYNAGQPDAIAALRDVSLRVAPGELVALIGHNGSGKSTLAKLLAAILAPTAGAISVDGIPSNPANVWEIRRRVGMVFQRPDDQLVANTVIDDVSFGPENLGLPREEIERRVHDSLAALGLGGVTHTQISELSGGEKQRVAIAGVLAMQPSYLILDEPTTMIAPAMARQLIALAHDLRAKSGLAVLHITHFMHEIVSFDRLVVMDGGRVLMQGSPREVFARADELRTVGLSVPLVTTLGRRLRQRGVALPEVVLTAQELAEALGARGQGSGIRGQGSGASALALADDVASSVQSHAQDGESSRPPTPNPRPLIEVRDLRYTYLDGTPLAQEALRGVDCALYEG
ncbi:MAG TPA: energy-coupling factor transporter ATPase, partial [Roseiflexaceae bacterium]